MRSQNLMMNPTTDMSTMIGATAITRSMKLGIKFITAVRSSWIEVKFTAADTVPIKVVPAIATAAPILMNLLFACSFTFRMKAKRALVSATISDMILR